MLCIFIQHRLNVAVLTLELLLSTWQITGSNICPETGYPDENLSWVFFVFSGNCWYSTLK
jgi:hypothetical protein